MFDLMKREMKSINVITKELSDISKESRVRILNYIFSILNSIEEKVVTESTCEGCCKEDIVEVEVPYDYPPVV